MYRCYFLTLYNAWLLFYLFVAAIGAIRLEWAGPAPLRVKGGAEADVVSGCGADE